MSRTLIIAEAGVNHNGDLGIAKKLIEVAAAAKADIVKFQSFNPSNLVTRKALKAEYQWNSTTPFETQFEMLEKLQLTNTDLEELFLHAKNFNIEFMSTAFDLENLEFLISKGFKRFKIPSGEITNYQMLSRVGRENKDVILSTGMATIEEIADAIEVLEQSGTSRDRITVLHCTSSYPAKFEDINLNAMLTISEFFNIEIGYSDHSLGSAVSLAAVALGAKVIEKHFTLDRDLPGPDHSCSLEANELTKFVSDIRNVEIALGSPIKKPTTDEEKNKLTSRKSLVALKKISKGEIFTLDNLGAKRPGNGISPMLFPKILDTVAKRDYDIDELIEL